MKAPEDCNLAFDDLAATYDREFTATVVGRYMRQAVWARLSAVFAAGARVLEINCGTGEDAVFLARRGVSVLATDRSAPMLSIARAKVDLAGVSDRVTFAHCAIESLDPSLGEFDGLLSNFGGLNMVESLPDAARRLAPLMRPGAPAVVCLMGRWVPWEWAWFLRRGRPRVAFRRVTGGAEWQGHHVRYPTIAAVSRAFQPAFTLSRVSAVGALLPPSYANVWAERHPRLVARLNGWERRLETRWPLPALADHVLFEFERA
jgi:SAM-dependent methyltransferase